jgi:hypothetical protein
LPIGSKAVATFQVRFPNFSIFLNASSHRDHKGFGFSKGESNGTATSKFFYYNND